MSKIKRSITLALQGGGSHGAFTWGVIDRLLEENISVEGISGTSAGAMNAAAFASGYIKEGNKGAKNCLDNFWQHLSEHEGSLNPYQLWSQLFPYANLDWSPLAFWKDLTGQIFSPYIRNPFNYNPLLEVIRHTIDLPLIQQSDKIKLFICATNIETNRIKVFENKELCEEALLASACLPMLHYAVKWNDHYYWDGGFMGNPMLEPLIYNCHPRDLLIIQVSAVNRPGYPYTSRAILDRLNEVTFNASFMREIRNIVNIQKLSEGEFCNKDNPYASLRLHCIQNEDYISHLNITSKYNTDWNFLKELKEQGRKTADLWLKENLDNIGVEGTMDLGIWRMETPSTTCVDLTPSLKNHRK